MPHINDLPPEILGEIFVQVTTVDGKDIYFPSKINFALPAPYSPHYRSVASPYSISHVSRRWRDIALDTAALWSRLCVVQPQTKGIVRLLEEWVTRAGSLPLRLSLYEHSYHQPSATVAVLVFFLNAIHRCTSFEMDVKTLAGRHPDYSRIGTREPTVLLQSVSVRIDDTPGSTPIYRPFIVTRLLSSPNLRFVQWHHNQLLPLPVASHFWSELRELRLETEVNLVDLIYALSYCQNLERLAVFRVDKLQRRCPLVTLQRLTHLSASSQAIVLFNCLIVSSLTDLEIFVGGEWWSAVLGMLCKSKVMPRVLKLRGVDCTHWPEKEEEVLLALAMRRFAALQVLEVEHLVGPRTIEFLLSRILPHLKRLVLTIDPHTPSSLLSDFRLRLPNRPDGNMNHHLEHTPDGFRLSLDVQANSLTVPL